MKVAIDISQIVYGTGVSVYTKSLVRSLLELDKDNQYVIFGGSLRRFSLLEQFASELKGNFKKKLVKMPPTMADALWNRLHIMPIDLMIGHVDVFHSSDWAQPPSNGFKVTTIHDLSPIKFPEFTPKKNVDVHTRRLSHVKREVDRIIVPSLASKNDLIELGYRENIIRVIPEAADPIYKRASEEKIEQVKQKYGLNAPYILSIGINPRKNTKRILAAYGMLKKNINCELVLVGTQTGLKLKPEAGVIITGHVPIEDMPALYSGALCLLYPSLYEGFGLPILEAFACKCPVVASKVSSLPEVAGDAAILVDPFKEESIMLGVQKAIKSKNILVKRGLKRVKSYNWNNTAEQTLKVYQESQ